MSLINDALKRASQSHQRQGSIPEEAAPMIPAPTATGAPVARLWLWGIGALVVGLVVVAAFALRRGPSPAPIVMAPAPPVAAPVAAKVVEKIEQPAPAAPVPVAPVRVAVAPPAPVEVRAAAAAIEPVVKKPSFPVLKLEAIFFTKANPQTMINGKTLGIGEIVADCRVKAIGLDEVTVEWNGETKALKLANP